MKNLNVVAWDNGYDYEKLVIGYKNRVKFPSISCIAPSMNSIFYDENYEFQKNKMMIKYEDKSYLVGNYAIQQDYQGGERNYEKNKYKDDSEAIKFLSGLYLLNEDGVNIDILVLGLSLRSYEECQKDIVSFYKNTVFKYKIENKDYRTIINDVLCIPQGVGSYYNEILNKKGKVKENDLLDIRYGLIDIGGNTTDIFIGEGVEPIKDTNYWLPEGLSDVFKNVSDTVPYNLIQKAFLNDKEQIVFEDTKIKDLQKKCKEQAQIKADRIYNKVIDLWNRQLPRVQKIMLTGGGSKILKPYLKEQFVNNYNKDVILVNDPQFANALGYWKLGKYHQDREMKKE